LYSLYIFVIVGCLWRINIKNDWAYNNKLNTILKDMYGRRFTGML